MTTLVFSLFSSLARYVCVFGSWFGTPCYARFLSVYAKGRMGRRGRRFLSGLAVSWLSKHVQYDIFLKLLNTNLLISIIDSCLEKLIVLESYATVKIVAINPVGTIK